MKYPKDLIQKVKRRSEGFQLEGINEGAGPINPQLMIIGEAPGREEIKSQIPFHGASGKELMKSLASIGLTREDVYITSTVRSRPYSIRTVFDKKTQREVTKYPNRKPTQKEVLAHAPFFDYEIKQVKPRLIVAVGNTALERLLGKGRKISLEHGKVIQSSILQLNEHEDDYIWSKNEYIIFPQYHPAAVFYNRKLTDEIAKDWLVIKPYLEKKN